MSIMNSEIIIFCDGGSRGNPGPAASAYVVVSGNQVIHKESAYLGNETNNVAEYNAVLLAIKWLAKNNYLETKNVVINLDSQLVERQLNGVYKIKNAKLKNYYDEIKKTILDKNLSLKFIWNYRENNELADKLVNEELDKNIK